MKTTLLFALLTVTFMGIFYACTKVGATTAATTEFRVQLTDSPVDAQAIQIDIREIRVNYLDEPDEWYVLNTKAGVYNLRQLQHGMDTTIASGFISPKSIGEIRFVLGTNNSIRIGRAVYPLTIPGDAKEGLKVKLGRSLRTGTDSVLIDFDPGLSVHQTENGTYLLKPVLKLR